MKQILFYGNCQVGSLAELMKSGLSEYKIIIIPCWTNNIEKNNFLSIIKQANIIITQPIQPNYQNTNYLHTEFILENANKNTEIFIFPSLHFDFYYFDLTYKYFNGEILHDPSDYHYNKIIDTYLENKNEEYFIKNCLENLNYKLADELDNIANNSLNELSNREILMDNYANIFPCKIIKVSEYIKNNYKKKLLFYSMNHPTKYVAQHICEIIFDGLNINKNLINYNIDPLYHSERGIIYKCIKNAVEFDIDTHNPHLGSYKCENSKEIIKIYFDHYKKINLN